MVQQARDQLQSNATQEDLKAVFEGSCELIPLKIVAKQCIKMADNFVPELVEALSSQMNPQVKTQVDSDRKIWSKNILMEIFLKCGF